MWFGHGRCVQAPAQFGENQQGCHGHGEENPQDCHGGGRGNQQDCCCSGSGACFGIGPSMKVSIAALDSEKGSSNFLILNCFLLAWSFTFLHLFFASLVSVFFEVCAFVNGDMVGLLG